MSNNQIDRSGIVKVSIIFNVRATAKHEICLIERKEKEKEKEKGNEERKQNDHGWRN